MADCSKIGQSLQTQLEPGRSSGDFPVSVHIDRMLTSSEIELLRASGIRVSPGSTELFSTRLSAGQIGYLSGLGFVRKVNEGSRW